MQVPLNPESSTSPDIECKRERNEGGAIELPAIASYKRKSKSG